MPCLQAIPRVSSFLLCCLGTAATPGFRCTKAVSPCPVLQLRGSRCWCPRDPSVFVVLCLCVLLATFWLSWKGGRSPGCLCLRFVSVLHTAAVEIHLSSTVHCAHPVSIPGAVPPGSSIIPPRLCSGSSIIPRGCAPALGCSGVLSFAAASVATSKVAAASLSQGRLQVPRVSQAGAGSHTADITSHSHDPVTV